MIDRSGFNRCLAYFWALLLIFTPYSPLLALPSNGQVKAGVAQFQQLADRLTVQQTSQRAVIHWDSFSIAGSEQVEYLQPGSNSAALNRVTGASASEIMGQLRANGQVYLLNPNGILIGANAVVDTQGFLASTADYADEVAFMRGEAMQLSGAQAPIVVEGTIRSGNGDTILLAKTVKITDGASISGKSIHLLGRTEHLASLDTDIYAAVEQNTQDPDGFILQSGTIDALEDALLEADYINHPGQTQGGSDVAFSSRATVLSGDILASNDSQAGSIAIASRTLFQTRDSRITANGASAGSIHINSEKVNLSGTLSAQSQVATGGNIVIEANEIYLFNTVLNASGELGGGSIRVGGDFAGQGTLRRASSVEALGVTLNADALTSGDGGSIVLWSDVSTTMTGYLSAQGKASGAGGKAEVSSADVLQYNAQADVSAESGNHGTILWDPKNIIITTDASAQPFVRYTSLGDSDTGIEKVADFKILQLQNGNVLVANPYDDTGTDDAGAVYLLDSEGSIISVLTGSVPSDNVGLHDVSPMHVVEADADHVILSNPNWRAWRGAVTVMDTNAGLNGIVDSTNSLVGTTSTTGVTDGDRVGKTVIVLNDGNFVTSSADWNDDVGYVMWNDITAPVTGNVIDNTNAMLGDAAGDRAGEALLALEDQSDPTTTNGFIALSPNYTNTTGAVNWFDGTGAINGTISSNHHIEGSREGDNVGLFSVALTNGNFVTWSHRWGETGEGAVTWGSGTAGFLSTGAVSSSNSLVGSTGLNHQIGLGRVTFGTSYPGRGVTALANGDYVVVSPAWSNWKGAVTFGNGATGTTGTVNQLNSFYGTQQNDMVGNYGITELSTGAVVIKSGDWNGARGAATYISKSGAQWLMTTGIQAGSLSSSNSMIGTTAGDYVGAVVQELTAGTYALLNAAWTNGSATRAGAFTFVNPTTKENLWGTVNAGNSLVGSHTNDNVGQAVDVLANGNLVVRSNRWNNYRGAITFMEPDDLVRGVLDETNSLVGANSSDYVGRNGLALANGNYITYGKYYGNFQGHITWIDGTTGSLTGGPMKSVGTIDASNSIIGANANDRLGESAVAFDNGTALVLSPNWNGNRGAITKLDGVSGLGGITLDSTNSVIGNNANDFVGELVETSSDNTLAVVVSSNYDGARGAITPVYEGDTLTGTLSATNSLIGGVGDSFGLNRDGQIESFEMSNGDFMIISEQSNGGNGDMPISVSSGSVFEFGTWGALDAYIHPDAITNTLDTGSNVILQANNDISVLSDIIANNAGGDGGNLSFFAGRSISIDADIDTDNGNMYFYANADLADGVVDAYRDAGDANFTMAAGSSLDAGTGIIEVTLDDGVGKTNQGQGDITLQDITANTLFVLGYDAGSTLTFGNVTATDFAMSFQGDVGQSAGSVISASGNALIQTSATSTSTLDGNNLFTTISLLDGDYTINNAQGLSLLPFNASDVVLTAAGDITDVDSAGLSIYTGASPFLFTGTAGLATRTLVANATGGNDVILDDDDNSAWFSEGATGNNISLINSGAMMLSGITATGTLNLTASGSITDTGTVTAAGNATLSAAGNTITLNDVNNDFSTVMATAHNLTLNDVNAINIGASTITNRLELRTGGDITQSAVLTIPYTLTINSPGATATLDNAGNDFQNRVMITADTATITDINELRLGGVNMTGDLTLNTAGTIRDLLLPTLVAGITTINNAGFDVLLNEPTNDFGTIGVNAEDVQLTDANDLVLDSSTLTGTLDISIAGDLTQVDAVSVAGNTTLTANDITLTNPGNDFNGISTNAANVSLADTNALEIRTSTITGNMEVTAGSDITDGGVIDVAGNALLATTANIVLDSANLFTRIGLTTGGGASDATIVNDQDLDLLPSLTDVFTINVNGNLTDFDSPALNTYTGASPHPFTGQAGIIKNTTNYTASGAIVLDDPDSN